MPYNPILPAEIEVGDPLKKELFDKFAGNDADFDERVTDLEIAAKKIPIFKYLLLNGSVFPTATGLDYYEADEDFTITDAFIRIFEKGILTGGIEIDIKLSRTNMDNASFTTIFTTKPKINYAGATDYMASTNQVFNSSQIDIVKGNYLRLDITQAPVGGVLPKLLISCYGE